MGISVKKAKYFILCNGKYFMNKEFFEASFITKNMILESTEKIDVQNKQLSLFYEE